MNLLTISHTYITCSLQFSWLGSRFPSNGGGQLAWMSGNAADENSIAFHSIHMYVHFVHTGSVCTHTPWVRYTHTNVHCTHRKWRERSCSLYCCLFCFPPLHENCVCTYTHNCTCIAYNHSLGWHYTVQCWLHSQLVVGVVLTVPPRGQHHLGQHTL